MRLALRCICALFLLGSAVQAGAQANVQVTGTANNIPFPTQCRATAGVQYTFGETARARSSPAMASPTTAKPSRSRPILRT